jgi:hypothetical protein
MRRGVVDWTSSNTRSYIHRVGDSETWSDDGVVYRIHVLGNRLTLEMTEPRRGDSDDDGGLTMDVSRMWHRGLSGAARLTIVSRTGAVTIPCPLPIARRLVARWSATSGDSVGDDRRPMRDENP